MNCIPVKVYPAHALVRPLSVTRRFTMRRAVLCMLILAFAYSGTVHGDSTVSPAKEYVATAQALEAFIAAEVENKRLPALSIALVDDQRIVWSRGFGFANPKAKTPATADTVY